MNTKAHLNPGEFGKVAVLYGGWSSERQVSLNSGAAVLEGLQARGVDAHGVDVDRDSLLGLKTQGFDTAWLALHGAGGEDGVAQAVLEVQGIAYTGSGVQASALAMDKARCKAVWAARGIPTPRHRLLDENSDFAAVASELGLPLVVKPAGAGSSVGMSLVEQADQLQAAFAIAREFDDEVMAEQFVSGGEYTGAVLNGRVLPLLKIETNARFYDYHAKYEAEDTNYRCPCGLSEDEENRLAALCKQAFEAVGAHGWGRVDFMLDASGEPWFLEINTIPGMTSHSLVPMCAGAAGIDFEELVWQILQTSKHPRQQFSQHSREAQHAPQ